MPFDCTPVSELTKELSPRGSEAVEAASGTLTARLIRVRPVPPWYLRGRPDRVETAITVLSRARTLIADERRWCKRAYAVGPMGISVSPQSAFARRYCALGAIRRAGWELGLLVEDAGSVLEWQTRIPVPDWNDTRTHPEVIAKFDAAIAALEAVPG